MSGKPIAVPDVSLYDPIGRQTFTGVRTFMESGHDWDRKPLGRGEPRISLGDLYFVHKIAIPKSFTLKIGQPFIIQNFDTKRQWFGVLTSFQITPELPVPISAEYGATGEEDKMTYSYGHELTHLVFADMCALDFFELVEKLRELHEHKVKETPTESRS